LTYAMGADGAYRVVDVAGLKACAFEIGPLRPPSEGGRSSLLLRVTRNCPWNRCTFCYGTFYNREPFEMRSVPDLKSDIDAVKVISDQLGALSSKLGYSGKLGPLAPILDSGVLYTKEAKGLDEREFKNLYCLITVFNWLVSGGETCFLQDADTPFMETDHLVEVIDYLRETFPSLKKITSFARSKTLASKTQRELSRLRQAGIIRLYVGLETGDDALLRLVDKGVTAEEHIQAGKKAIAAGFELSEIIMPGLGGRTMWRQHAENTARVLNEIDPQFIGLSPFVPVAGTPLLDAYQRGEFQVTSPHERLQEIKLMIENLKVTSRVCFTHPFNASHRSGRTLVPLMKQDFAGYKFPEEKGLVLELLDKGLQLDEKLFFDLRHMAGIDHL
jgi:radical SAM superfamily enzyme YgiQ (UPF0313 family)